MGQSGTPRVIDELTTPNRLCFSPDHMKLHIVDTGEGAGDIKVFDVTYATRPANPRLFTDMVTDGEKVGPDAVRADINRNIWTSGGWAGYGFNGIHCFTPQGERIGHVRLPQTTSNRRSKPSMSTSAVTA